MSKRFTDTEKWDRPWFRKLPLQYKLLWCFVLDRCDIAGVWYVDLDMAAFMIGHEFNKQETEAVFEKQIQVKGERWLIRDFIGFQYGVLTTSNKLFPNVMMKLEGFDKGASMPHTSPIYGAKDKDKSVVVLVSNKKGGMGENKRTTDITFNTFWSAYPRKVAKESAWKVWDKLRPTDELLRIIIQALEKWKKTDQWRKDDGQFIPHPATWLNQRRWEDEIKVSAGHRDPIDKLFGQPEPNKSPDSAVREHGQANSLGEVSGLFRRVDKA